MKLKGYCIAIVDESGVPSLFYDGISYQKEAGKMRIFAQGDIEAARYEQGNHQRLNATLEVRVFPVAIEILGVPSSPVQESNSPLAPLEPISE